MTPKPITRKVDGEGNLPPVNEFRSPLSIKLEALKKAQQDAVESLSPNADKLLKSMIDNDRYAMLIGDDGLISKTKTTASADLEKVLKLAREFMEVVRFTDLPKDGEIAHDDLIENFTRLRRAARDLSSVASILAIEVKQIMKMENELEILEPRIMDEAGLPDFEALNNDAKKAEVDAICAMASRLMEKEEIAPLDDVIPSHPDGKIPADSPHLAENRDKPIKWIGRIEWNDVVTAPSLQGAKAMIAMRARHKIEEQHVKVWCETKLSSLWV